ncbi:hypothetical protein [Bacillus infantis]|uniref:hypothetical protein n=1 Tax=Bacillus infantis TaxID=324767 RepID=UPI003CE73C41
MDAQTKQNLELRKQITNLGYEIAGDIDHGECFYEKEMLDDFIANLDKLKNAAREYYISNKAEEDES